MAVPFKVTPSEYAKIKNDPLHYDLNMSFNSKSNMYEGETDPPTMKRIQAVLDSPEKNQP